jgi:hypothetical protein
MFGDASMKTLFLICTMALTACVAGFVYGQSSPQASVGLPVLSFVVDDAHQLRPVIGVVGSASVGAPLDLGLDVLGATMPSGQNYVLATTAGNSWPVLLQPRGGTMVARSMESFVSSQAGLRRSNCSPDEDRPLPRRGNGRCVSEPSVTDATGTIDRIALSPSGSAAALFSESQNRIYAFINLAQTPVLAGKFELGALRTLNALAISDDARTIAAGVSDASNASLFLVNAGQPPRFVASMNASSIAFMHGSDTAVVADNIDNKIYALVSGQPLTLATAADGIASPAGIAVSNDNQRIFVANSQTGSVLTLAPNGSVVDSQSCNCALTGLHSTNADSVFRLTDYVGGPVSIFEARGSAPRIIFIR